MNRRDFLDYGIALGLTTAQPNAFATDKWGADKDYPSGSSLLGFNQRDLRIGNYSGGFDKVFPYNEIKPSTKPFVFTESKVTDFKYRWGFFKKSPEDYLDQWPSTGLLICRGSSILYETYRHKRTADMRFWGWSMSKSVTSLLLGACIDRGLVQSLDDPAFKYVPKLQNTLHGGTTLRNLCNMSSGASIDHEKDARLVMDLAFTTGISDVETAVMIWNKRATEQGQLFNYNELCPLTIGMVIRSVTGNSLASYAEKVLWQPIGAENTATWATDSNKREYNCIGFAATLRDWAKLGKLIADNGKANGQQVISESWIYEMTHWRESENQVRYGRARPDQGYKAFVWHANSDGSRPYFNGFGAQRVFVDLKTKTVMVHTGVEQEGNWQKELYQMFQSATEI